MPPWKPEPGHGQFQGERRLSDAEIALVQRWVAQGMMRGDPQRCPAGSAMARRVATRDARSRRHHASALRAACAGARCLSHVCHPDSRRRAAAYVRAVEFQPGNPAVVHHANIKIDRTRLSRRRDTDEPGAGYEGGGSREAKFPDGMFLGWTPGQSPRLSPEGMSWHLEPDSDLVVELHLMPGTKCEPVQVSVGLFFTDRAPERTGYMLRLGRQDIDIAPGRRDYVNADAYTLPVGVEALAVQPHAHFLATEVRAWATLPGRQSRAAHLHQGLGFPLAGCLHLCAAGRSAEGHDDRDAVHLRQFVRESSQSESSAQARDVWSDQRVGNGIALAPGRAA